MKKSIILFLSMICVLFLTACNTKSMNYIIANKPSVTGIVKEVHDDYIIMYSETAAETSPLQVSTVYAITLKTPAKRTVDEESANRNLWRDFLNFPYFTGFPAP